MIEIAISLAIIGFALVAIIGVLPLGMQIQRDTRADTLINQDGNYWTEAIRNGAEGLDELTNVVDAIWFFDVKTDQDQPPIPFFSGRDIVGLLSTPGGKDSYMRSVVRAIGGSAVEKSTSTRDVAFKYLLTIENREVQQLTPEMDPALRGHMQNRLREIKLEFRWPIIGDPTVMPVKTGNGRQVFRTLVGGALVVDTNQMPNLYFFKQ